MPHYAPSDSEKTAQSDDEEKRPPSNARRTLSILPTIPHNRASDAMSNSLSRQNHRTLERTNSLGLTRPRRVDAGSRIPVDFRTLRCVLVARPRVWGFGN